MAALRLLLALWLPDCLFNNETQSNVQVLAQTTLGAGAQHG